MSRPPANGATIKAEVTDDLVDASALDEDEV
jgi:hypothetical protein